MAKKDHTLDQAIIEAAKQEFLENGFEKASLRKIATNANVTIGAIYTRYKTKDILFTSLVAPFISNINSTFITLQTAYNKVEMNDFNQLLESNKVESDAILHLLFDDYTSAKLLLCKSTGSSLEHFFDELVERKIIATLQYFHFQQDQKQLIAILKILITSQFHSYFQIIQEGYELAEAKQIMHIVIQYHLAGWQSLFLAYQSK